MIGDIRIYRQRRGTIGTLSSGLHRYDRGSREYLSQLAYLQAMGTEAIKAVRTCLHQGIANMVGLDTGHKFQQANAWHHLTGTKPPRVMRGRYRRELMWGLTDHGPADATWFDQMLWLAESARQTKAAVCDGVAALVFAWCVMNARCRVSEIKIPNFDHHWVVLTLGIVNVVIDGWVRRPALCFPHECRWYDERAANLMEIKSVDVLEPNAGVLHEFTYKIEAIRANVKQSVYEDKLGNDSVGILCNYETCLKDPCISQLDRLIHNRTEIMFVPIPDRHLFQFRKVVPLAALTDEQRRGFEMSISRLRFSDS